MAPVLAALLLIPDSRTSLDQAAGLIGDVIDGTEVSRLLQEVDDLPQWPDIATALDRLADYLGADSTPIDYGRRRLLDYTGLLPHDRWLEICRHTGTPPGTGRRERIARSQLFQRLSGLPAESAPDDLGGPDSAEFRATSLRFTALQTPELAHALQQEALNFLASHHIHDEPMTWQPPATLLAGLSLPGPDRHTSTYPACTSLSANASTLFSTPPRFWARPSRPSDMFSTTSSPCTPADEEHRQGRQPHPAAGPASHSGRALHPALP